MENMIAGGTNTANAVRQREILCSAARAETMATAIHTILINDKCIPHSGNQLRIKVPEQYCVALSVCPSGRRARPVMRISPCVMKPHISTKSCCARTRTTHIANKKRTLNTITPPDPEIERAVPTKGSVNAIKISGQPKIAKHKQRNENHSAPRRSRFCVMVLPIRDGVASEYPITHQNARHRPTCRRSLHTKSCCMACEPSVPSAGRAHI